MIVEMRVILGEEVSCLGACVGVIVDFWRQFGVDFKTFIPYFLAKLGESLGMKQTLVDEAGL